MLRRAVCGIALAAALSAMPALGWGQSVPRDAGEDAPSIEPELMIEFEALDANGVEIGYLGTPPPSHGWSMFGTYSGPPDRVVLDPGGVEVAIRATGCRTSCPYPLSPRGVFYSLDLPSGERCILRLPLHVGAEHGTTKLTLLDRTYFMVPCSPVAAARMFLQGEPSPVNAAEADLRNECALLDCLSLIAYTEERGQAETLTMCSELVSKLLADYRERVGAYPPSLDALVCGDAALLHTLPLNPYCSTQSLLEPSSAEAAGYGLVYVAELAPKPGGGLEVVGYWLGATEPGGAADPIKPLPLGTPTAPAYAWWEAHPSGD